MIEGTLRYENRVMLWVESEGDLSKHETAIREQINELRGQHGSAGIESVTLSTTTVAPGQVRYSSILLVQVG